MPQKAYLWILKIGMILSFLCVFFVFKNLLFPYITSKQIPFNILMEVLLVFWLAFIIKYPQWNPFRGITKTWPVRLFIKPKVAAAPAAEANIAEIRDRKNKNKNIVVAAEAPAPENKSSQLITFSLAVFFIVILVSCFFGVDFHMSFWSNAERMLGVYHILHFLVLYLVAITVFRDWNDWKIVFTTLLLAAVGVAIGSMANSNWAALVIIFLIFAIVGVIISGLNGKTSNSLDDTIFMALALLSSVAGVIIGSNSGQGEIYSTLGNSLYAAVFMIFAFYFILFLFFHKEGGDNKKKYPWLKWVYFLAIPFLYVQFYKVNKAGDTVGLLMGAATFIFLFGVINKRRVVRIASWILTLAVVGVIASAFIFHANPIIANNRFLSKFNTGRNTFQTRLLSWDAGVKDFHNHWLLGTGFGNYAIIFDKYFSAKFYNYTKTETYFDRAHNNVVDLTSTTGALGILAYLSIFVVVGIYLIRALRRGRIKPVEFSLIASLLVAYFIQNLDVFDSFVTYMCLMIVLGYVHWLANTNEDRGNTRALLSTGGTSGFPNREIFALIGAGLVATFLIYNYAVLPLRMLDGVIQGQMAFSKGDFATGIQLYKEALAKNTPIDKDGRSMLERAIADYAWNLSKLPQAQAADIIAFGVQEGEKNLAYNPHDSLMQMELARVYDAGFKIVTDNGMRSIYAKGALDHINKSIAASPQRVPVYFIKSQIEIGQNRIDDAISTLEYAATITDVFPETQCQLGQIYLIKQNDLIQKKSATSTIDGYGTKAWAAMDVCLDNNGASNLAVTDVIKESIDHYVDKKDVDKVIQLYEQLVQYESNAQYFVTLARLYEQKGEIDKAIAAAGQAASIDPSLKTDADAYIKQLQNNQ
jgi:tetratricopeptide (TPR) repeat protein